jgi:hypothetical protein
MMLPEATGFFIVRRTPSAAAAAAWMLLQTLKWVNKEQPFIARSNLVNPL